MFHTDGFINATVTNSSDLSRFHDESRHTVKIKPARGDKSCYSSPSRPPRPLVDERRPNDQFKFKIDLKISKRDIRASSTPG